MKKTTCLIPFLLFLSFHLWSTGTQERNEIYIAAGAGYKKPITEICDLYTDDTGVEVHKIFGNMQTVSMQVKESGMVGFLVGDKKFLNNPSLGVQYREFVPIGEGILVLAYPEGRVLSDPSELLHDTTIKRVSMPDIQKAIYGQAAMEYLKDQGLWEDLQGVLIPASTVPQVSSYLISGEIDAGFINLTDAIAIKEKIGGYITLKDGYSSIEIVGGLIDGYEEDELYKGLIQVIKSPEAGDIFERYGL